MATPACGFANGGCVYIIAWIAGIGALCKINPDTACGYVCMEGRGGRGVCRIFVVIFLDAVVYTFHLYFEACRNEPRDGSRGIYKRMFRIWMTFVLFGFCISFQAQVYEDQEERTPELLKRILVNFSG